MVVTLEVLQWSHHPQLQGGVRRSEVQSNRGCSFSHSCSCTTATTIITTTPQLQVQLQLQLHLHYNYYSNYTTTTPQLQLPLQLHSYNDNYHDTALHCNHSYKLQLRYHYN